MSSYPQFSELTALYVEDEPVARLSIGTFLKRQLGELHLAENGKEGFELFESHRPQVVITDLEMPVMNGMEMIRRIRELDNGTPIIITTAYDDGEHRCEQADRVILKPIIFNDLLKVINECIEKRQTKSKGC